MVWGTFSVVHILSLILAVLINVAIYFVLKRRGRAFQMVVLLLLTGFGLFDIIWNLVKWNSPLEYLPLHLCTIFALMMPILVLTKSEMLGNLALLWCFGSCFALVFNGAVASAEITDPVVLCYYFTHVFDIGIPLIMLKLKMFKKNPRCIFSTLMITFICYSFAHLMNLVINHYTLVNEIVDWKGELVTVNYMYTLAPINSLMEFFYNLCPIPYLYGILFMPIILGYLAVLYLPQIVKEIKELIRHYHLNKRRKYFFINRKVFVK